MNTTFTSIRIFFERNGFNVSTRLAERLGLRVKYVRLFFIYISFNSEMLAQFIHFEEADNDNDPICLKGKHWELIKLDIEEAVIKEN